MAKKRFLQRNERILSLLLIIAVVLVWAAVFLLDSLSHVSSPSQPTMIPGQTLEGCYIEYGFSECIEGSLVTAFFNPGTEDLRRVSMYFYDGDDVDIYNCREPLRPGEPATLTTIDCTEDLDTSRVKLEWCCGEDCYDTMMDNPSDDLSLVQAGEVALLSPRYPTG